MPTSSQARGFGGEGGPVRAMYSPDVHSYIQGLYSAEPVRDPYLARQLGRPASAAPQSERNPYGYGVLVGGATPPAEDGYHYGPGPIMMTPRKLRGPQLQPPSDAAGQLTNGRWKGRDIPRKGHGLPPADNREEVHVRMKAVHPKHSHLLSASQRDPLGWHGYCGLGGNEGGHQKTGRKTMTVSKPSDEYGNRIFGGVLKPMSESGETVPPPARRSKGTGAPPPALAVNTSSRVLGTSAALTADDINPGAAACHRTPEGVRRRPATAAAAYRDNVGGVLTQEWATSNRTNTVAQHGWRQVERHAQEARLADSKAVWSDAHASGTANRLRGMRQSFAFGARRSALRHSSDAVSVAPVSGRHDGGRRGRASARLVAAAAKRGKSPAGKRTRGSKPAEGRRRELNGLQAAVLSLDFNTRVALGIGVQVVCWLGLFYFATSGQ
eukprot:jgi/Tetstr1/438673/TSEL_027223.t1